MKIKVLPTGDSPEYYNFNGEVVTAYKDGLSEEFDLSLIQVGDKFEGVEPDTLELSGSQILRNVYRDENGELHADICQKVGPGHWEAGLEYDSADYVPDIVNVVYRNDKPHAGTPWAITKTGKQGV